MEARALVGEARALYFPTVSFGPSYNRQRSSANLGPTSTTANPGKTSQIYSLPLEVSWTPDLFGRIRNQVRAAQYSAQVSAADLENEKLAEQADLAEFYFEIRGQDALIDLLTQTVATYQKSLDLTQAQYDTGVGDQISVVEARTTLQSAQASLTNLGILRAQYEHAIAVLLGKPASGFSLPKRALTTAPPPIPIGVPSLLLQRRPDVAAAERTMASANATLGVAYAAFFPSLTLSASGGFDSYLFKHLVDWPSRFWSVGPSFSAPIFNAALKAELHQYVAIYNADVATYRQTVLTAFQQVEDYLAQTRILSQQIEQQRAALGFRKGVFESGDGPIRNRRRSLHRCGDAAEHGTEQPADRVQPADRADDRRGAISGGLRRRLGYLAIAHSGAGLADPAQGGYADSTVERLQRLDLLCRCSQPQADALMRWRRTKLIRECLAAGALEEDEVEQTACSFLREQPFQFQPVGMVREGRPGLKQRVYLDSPLGECPFRQCAYDRLFHG